MEKLLESLIRYECGCEEPGNWPRIRWGNIKLQAQDQDCFYQNYKPIFDTWTIQQLHQKYRNYKNKNKPKVNNKVRVINQFTQAEDDILKERVKECVEKSKIQWKKILEMGGFDENRSVRSLQFRWRYLEKHGYKTKQKKPQFKRQRQDTGKLPDLFQGKSWKERQFGLRYFRSCDTLDYYRDLCEERAKIEPKETVEMHMKAILGIEKGEIEDLNNFLKGNLSNRDLQALARRSHDLSTIEGEFLFSQEEIFLHVVRKNHVDENGSVNWDRFITSGNLVRCLGEEGRELNKAQLASKWNNHKRRKTK